MNRSNTFVVTAIIAITFIACGIPSRGNSQTISYDDEILLINTFEKQKVNTNKVTGPMLDQIVEGLIQNDGLPPGSNPSDGIGDSEGLKKRLVGGAGTTKIRAQAALTPSDGNLLQLLYYTRQSVVPAFITDDQLRGLIGGKNGTGAAIKSSMSKFWNNQNISNNFIECLEGFPSAQAAVLVDVISATWYRGSAGVYEKTITSWASQSCWQIYHDGREVELAKRSAVVKLLANQGYLTLPTVTYAQFIWSQGYYGYDKWPDIPIYWDTVSWSQADIPDLTRLLSNPYYSAAAQVELNALTGSN